ncbi:MAG: hypothetical protein P8M59_02065 [Candidatus Marinimicrobia bacterium]|nr:hypothetical protein [Candidatus Neomarinimicrobiota bacterium]
MDIEWLNENHGSTKNTINIIGILFIIRP